LDSKNNPRGEELGVRTGMAFGRISHSGRNKHQ
jgi:hypothetical protein